MKTRITFALLGSVLSTLLLTPVSSAAPIQRAPEASPKVASYNVFMLAKSLYPNWGQDHRADLIDTEGVLNDQDVVVLQEAFDNAASDKLLGNLSDTYPEQTPVLGRSRDGWDATEGSYSDAKPEDGGVAVLSRWPIEKRVQYVYRDGCGADAMSNKGLVYTKITAPTGPLHVIGTHMQADDDACGDGGVGVRATQLREIAEFVASQKIPEGDTVMVGGDLNIDASSEEFTTALRTLDARNPVRAGHPHSYDPGTNSVAAYNSPVGPSQQLDHVLLLNGHTGPEQWTNETRAVHSPEWTVGAGGNESSYTDFSDHYPVFAYGR